MPTSVAFSPGKPESLEWFADACDIVADLLEHGIEVENVKHSFELAYYVAGAIPKSMKKWGGGF